MLKLIKKWLGAKERIGLTLESLEPWFDKKTKVYYDNFNNRLAESKQNISEEIGKTKDNLKNLEAGQLHNESITTKEKQFMEGNREAYIKKVLIFIESIDIPEDNLDEFAVKTKNNINDLGKSTAKAYSILQHFFADESYAAAQNLKNIDTCLKEIFELISDKKLKDIQHIKQNFIDIKNTIKKEKELKDEMKKIENSAVDLEEEKKGIRFDLSKKEQSKEYKEYNTLEVEYHKLNEQLDEIKEEMLHFFAVLDHALKKQSKIDIEYESLINRYIENPIEALIEDLNLDILHILKKTEDNVRNGIIELKDKKEEKTLEIIRTLDQIKIVSFLKEYNHFKKELADIEEKTKSSIIIKEIEAIKEKIEDKDREMWELNKKLNIMNDEFSKININVMKIKLKEKINEFLDIELDID